MEYAIIKTGGKQYKAIVGETIDIDRLDHATGDSYEFKDVLLYKSDDVCQIGQPVINNISVTGKIIQQYKDKKIRVAKFKAKSRYRRVQGFRASLTKIKITEISTKETKPATTVIEKPVKEIKTKKKEPTAKK